MQPDQIARTRRFYRAVTTESGVLDSSYLGLGRPLGPSRVLNAIGHGMTELDQIRAYLRLDSGLLSRYLRGLEDEGLITTEASMTTAVIGLSKQISAAPEAVPKWNTLMASALVITLPPVMVVIVLQRWFVKGLVDSEK